MCTPIILQDAFENSMCCRYGDDHVKVIWFSPLPSGGGGNLRLWKFSFHRLLSFLGAQNGND